MSVALRRLRDRISLRINDADDRKRTYDPIRVDQRIASCYITLAAMLPAPDLYTASAFTISAGGDTFTLPTTVTGYTGNDGGAEYTGNIRIQLASTGRYLQWITMDQMDAFRNGQIPTPPHLSAPYLYTLWEEKDQDVQGRCYPGARDAEACHLFTSLKVDDLRDYVGAGTDDLDDVEVLFDREAANALELYVAADLLKSMTPKALELRDINPAIANDWKEEAMRLIYSSACRVNDLQAGGDSQRWVG